MPSSTASFWATFAVVCPRLSPAAVLEAYRTPEQLLGSPPLEIASRLGVSIVDALRLLSESELRAGRRRIELAEGVGQSVVCIDDANYPVGLKTLSDPPALLFVEGVLPEPDALAVAIVGARDASPQGVEHARYFARELARFGFVVVSGGARGVDAAAHQGALLAGGQTVAVRGSGLDVDYPRGHRELYLRIARRGCSVSEHPPGIGPRPSHFPRRNRIIAGWASGVLVVEAGQTSGSLVTARLALEQGRDIFAIPGALESQLSVGTNRLIQQGAKLVMSVEDLVEELAPQAARRTAADEPDLGPRAREVLRGLSPGPAGADELADKIGWPLSRLLGVLTELELLGLISPIPGGRFRLAAWGRAR